MDEITDNQRFQKNAKRSGKRGREILKAGLKKYRIALLMLVLAGAVYSQMEEYRVKAHFLGNFTRFVEWPASRAGDGPFVVTVIGEDPFKGILEEIYGKGELRGRPVEIRKIRRVQDIGESHLLFISGGEKENLGKILRAVEGKGMLTVSDSPGFGAKGVMINLYLDDDKVRFEINLGVVKDSGLTFDYKLLNLARIIKQ